MDEKLQQHIAFYLSGRRKGSALLPMDSSYRPALFARYGDLTSLRHDLPLVLSREGTPDEVVLSLSGLVDGAVEALGEIPEREAIARHGYRIERELRLELAANGGGNFASRWNAAVSRLASENENIQDSAKRLWAEFHADGDLVDVDPVFPTRVVRHAWSVVQAGKARTFRQKGARLLHKLRGILEAEMIGSAIGRTPERLRAGVGASFAGTFDFDQLSRILVEAKPGIQLSDERRRRIESLIDVLEKQRFYSLETDGREPYSFTFNSCSDALTAYRDRHNEAVELLKTLAIAELEASGDYRESVHNILFEGFGANGLDADELAKLPDYLVCVNSTEFDPAETVQLVDLLAAGLPINVLVQTDDLMEPSGVIDGRLALALRSRQMVHTAIGLTDVFVLQSSASHLFRMRDALVRGLTYNGPALFSVFSGANSHTGNFPAYLVAAAAMESRAFPALVYDPSAGPDWSTRLFVEHNPKSEDEWPVHPFDYEDEKLQVRSEKVAFTLADFMAMDARHFEHYAIVPRKDWSDAMNPVTELLQTDVYGLPAEVPCITLVDDECRVQRAIIDQSTLREVGRCRDMWRSLQELGGIHNSHVERLLAQGYKPQTAALPSDVAVTAVSTAVVTEPEITVEVSMPAPEENNGDDPYIETPRCTSCNECTQINNKMFAYDENKQAYIADPDAGTFRQLVEAAEGCQVSIIHPGKPHNPKEPGLEDLIKRAAEFN